MIGEVHAVGSWSFMPAVCPRGHARKDSRERYGLAEDAQFDHFKHVCLGYALATGANMTLSSLDGSTFDPQSDLTKAATQTQHM